MDYTNKLLKFLYFIFFAFLIIGCSSGSKVTMKDKVQDVSPYKTFSENINAFNETYDMKYLVSANKFASTDSEKALLESKLVSYLGAQKVFDIRVEETGNALGTATGKGLLGSSKSTVNNLRLNVSVAPSSNLPFPLKYNTYVTEIVVKTHRKYQIKSSKKDYIKNVTSGEDVSTIVLSKNNNWSKQYKVNTKITTNSESSVILLGRTKSTLLESQYSAKIYLKRISLDES